MPSVDPEKLKDLLDGALGLPAEQRQAFLEQACGRDEQLHGEVTSLLAALERANGVILQSPTAYDISTPKRTTKMPLSEKPGALVGRYKLLEQIGEGGMGIVFMAEQQQPVHRRVALKIIKPGMDSRQVIARFEAERQALAMMDHPGIARVFDAGATDAGLPYFVMELVRGIPITQYCDQHQLTPRQRLELFVPVCQAVQHAHQKGIIHRDLKPNNVLVTLSEGEKPVPKIIDFGIAKATGDQRLTDRTLFTEFRQLLGTPLYMSPEQAEMNALQDVDTRSDVYSLGVLLYELLTGTTPFDKERLAQAACDEIRRILRDVDPPAPSTRLSTLAVDTLSDAASHRHCDVRSLRRTLRGDLDWIVMKCLEKDRSRRYDSAVGLSRDIERYLVHEPVEASPPSSTYKLRKFARKHRAALGVAGGFALLLLLSAIISSIQAIRLTRSQAVAQRETQSAKNALILAEREVRRADAFNQFMRSILAHARPDAKGTGRDLHVVDLLDLASRESAERFKSQPDAEIEARAVLAGAYRALGLHAQARESFRRAYLLSASLPGGADSEQTLRLAGDLTRYGGVDLAQRTFDTAQRKLGATHPVTQNAANSLASALVARGDPTVDQNADIARAEQVLRALVEQVNAQPAETFSPAAYHYVNQFASLLNSEAKSDEAAEVARQGLDRARADPRAEVTATSILGENLVVALMAQGHLTQAADLAGDLLEYDRKNIGNFNLLTVRMLRHYVRVLARLGRSEQAERLLEDNIQLARAVHMEEGDILADLLNTLGQLRIDYGRPEQGWPPLVEFAELQRRLHGPSDAGGRISLREALAAKLGSKRQLADGTLGAQIFCALEDLWRDSPSDVPEPAAADPSEIAYSLLRWEPPDHPSVAQGTLATLPAPAELQPGLYLLGLETPASGPRRLRQAMWILISDWQVHGYSGPAVRKVGPAAWAALIAHAPDHQFEWPALAFLGTLADPPGGDDEYLALTARTRIDLPRGLYRISTTSDDGVRVFLDGRCVVNAWYPHRPRRDFCDVALEEGSHEIQVEYFRQGRRSALWVRMEPLSAEARSWAAGHGAHPLRTVQRALEEQGESRHPEALGARAALRARLGQLSEALQDYQAALAVQPAEPFWRQQCALLSLELGDTASYQKWRAQMLERAGPAADPRMAARTALIALLGSSATDRPLSDLLQRAGGSDGPPDERALGQLALGLADLRAGRNASALTRLSAAASGPLTPWARASAHLFRALALQHGGSTAQALAALDQADRTLHANPLPDDLEWDANEVQDWILHHLARREAESILKAKPHLIATTQPSPLH